MIEKELEGLVLARSCLLSDMGDRGQSKNYSKKICFFTLTLIDRTQIVGWQI